MKSYETDPFGARKATGNKLLEKFFENLIKRDKKGDKMSYQNEKETYKEWYKIIIKFTLPSNSLKSLSVEYVNDLYRGVSANNCSKEERGQSET